VCTKTTTVATTTTTTTAQVSYFHFPRAKQSTYFYSLGERREAEEDF